jgi:hypothetical protein
MAIVRLRRTAGSYVMGKTGWESALLLPVIAGLSRCLEFEGTEQEHQAGHDRREQMLKPDRIPG